MAPAANILVVESNGVFGSDQEAAVQYAANQPGVVVVSMSYGEPSTAVKRVTTRFTTTPA